MISVNTIEDIELLKESHSVEFKLAQGKDGQGVLPKDFWPTYSAFANTEGGLIVLGVRQKNERFIIEGIEGVDKVKTDLFFFAEQPQQSQCQSTNQ